MRKLLLVGLVSSLLAAGSAQAAGPLVPGELRLGPEPDAPLLVDSGQGYEAMSKPLTGLRYEAAAGGATLTCPAVPPNVVRGFAHFPGAPYHGLWSTLSDGCTASGLPGLTTVSASWSGFVVVRHEPGNLGAGRNGVLETIRGPFNNTFDFVIWTNSGPCEYKFMPNSRQDYFNPGHGHKIVLDREPLTRAHTISGSHYAACPGDDDPATVDAWVSQEVRMRAWDASTGTYSLPVWLHPAAQS